jgi:hypothetical protein
MDYIWNPYVGKNKKKRKWRSVCFSCFSGYLTCPLLEDGLFVCCLLRLPHKAHGTLLFFPLDQAPLSMLLFFFFVMLLMYIHNP